MWLKKEKKCRFFVPVAAVLIPTLLWCSVSWLLPDNLTLIEGEKTEISTQLPISAKTEESVNVLGVTTKPLADAFHLELGSSIMANPIQVGTTKVTFYLCNALPIKTIEATVIPKITLVPVGKTVGVSLDTKGLLVLGTGQVCVEGNETVEPCKGVLKTGDLLLKANGKELVNKETFIDVVNESKGEGIDVLLERKGSQKRVTIKPVYSQGEQAFKLGVWVRDSIQGIGTITFFDPKNNHFGALGHGVYDVDTGELMVIKNGSIIPSQLTDIIKGEKGEPGELAGIIQRGESLGEVTKNTEVGIYGTLDEPNAFQGTALPIALKQEIKIGKAEILSNIEGEKIDKYEIEIESIGKGSGKDMMIRVTDKRLLEKTGGIVQGMSGSPIIQNGQLIGAVTHVLVNDPERGYGTFIETMLQEISK
ncbi:SpoIVB peptidase [Anaerotignum sp. MB30-C6]|uniref:SpoIVB peptidase n=1 Tax=Anaerotignum sp. MB30-C6 TaxID=3070814 RepID=UPI0027DD1EE0|nr:SpoIVB peptidase [Anaerotignum sp. MB30-C6]WMI81715.1 SpoIVB peptidase [Anaerotignum sp. MB30-C6]